MLSSLPYWASCEVFPGKQPGSLVSMPQDHHFPWPAILAEGERGVLQWDSEADGIFGAQKWTLVPPPDPMMTFLLSPTWGLVHTPTPS
jgi:hypothetical protein